MGRRLNTWEVYGLKPALGECGRIYGDDVEAEQYLECRRAAEWLALWAPDGPGSEVHWELLCESCASGDQYGQRVNVAEVKVVGMSRAWDWTIPRRTGAGKERRGSLVGVPCL